MAQSPRHAQPDDASDEPLAEAGEHRTPAHALESDSGSTQNRRAWLIALAGLLAFGLVLFAVRSTRGTTDAGGSASGTTSASGASASAGGASASDASASGSSGSASPSAAASSCASTSTIATDPAWSAALTSVLTQYHATTSDGCAAVAVQQVAQASVAKSGLGQAKGWVPASPAGFASASTAAGSSQTVVAATPLVLVAQQQVKTALGSRTLGGTTLVQLASGTTDWKQLTGKNWGPLRLVLPDPKTTDTGAAGFGSLVALVAGNGTPTTDTKAVTNAMIEISQVQYHVTQTVSSDADVLKHLAAVASDNSVRGPAGPRVGITTEAALLASKPASGTLAAWPLLGGAVGEQLAIANPSNDKAVADFTTWLKGSEGQQALASAGLTTSGTSPDASQLANVGLQATPMSSITATSATQLAQSRALFQGLSVRMATTNVLDASGSMGNTVTGTGMRKIDVVTQAAKATWNKWPDGSAVDLLTFNADSHDKPIIQTVIPWTVVGEAGSTQRLEQAAQHVTDIKTGGGTPLYQAIWAGYSYALAHYSPGKTNQVFVITDGSDQDAKENITLTQLISKLQQADKSKPIRMRYLAVGAQADIATLRKIASATGGLAAQADSVQQLPQVMAGIMAR